MTVQPPTRPDGVGEVSDELLSEARRLVTSDRRELLRLVAQTADNMAHTERRVAAVFTAMAQAGGLRADQRRRLAQEASRCAEVAAQRAQQLRDEART